MTQFVIKRNGTQQKADKNKITMRLIKLLQDVQDFRHNQNKFKHVNLDVDISEIAHETIKKMTDGITTSELDILAAETCANNISDPDYAVFGGNILVSNLEKNNKDCIYNFAKYAQKAWNNYDFEKKVNVPLIDEKFYNLSQKYGHIIDKKIKLERNYFFRYFGLLTLIKGQYLLASKQWVTENNQRIIKKVPFETPQHMFMRVAIGINGHDEKTGFKDAFELYDILSMQYAIHATPTMFHAGTPKPQLSSCFLLDMKEDSIDGIYDTLKQCAKISKTAGGIGLNINSIRSAGSYIAGTNGESNGIVPMLRVYNETARYVDQGGGKRKGSFAMYIDPHHPDFMEFLELRQPVGGSEETRARDLFYAVWMSDLFMKRAKEAFSNPDINAVMWSFFDPNVVPELNEVHGQEYEDLYIELESKQMYKKQLPIRIVVCKILDAMQKTGTPYILFKDTINARSNQKNIGIIKSSNLCAEIVEHSSPTEIAVCNLASISLPAFVNLETNTFDFDKLQHVCQIMIRNLDRVIDVNYYPVQEAKHSNMRHRPIGLGIQGLGKLFSKMGFAFDSKEARLLNRRIAEVMYFASLTESCDLARKFGPHPSINENGGSPISNGVFQQDMFTFDQMIERVQEVYPDITTQPDDIERWNFIRNSVLYDYNLQLDWEGLRENIKEFGVRNSLVRCEMPTASSSQILANTECFEPYYGNIYNRKTKAGEFFQYNEYMVHKLKERNLWNYTIDPVTGENVNLIWDEILTNNGSLQGLDSIPQDIKDEFKCTLDLNLKDLTFMAQDRAFFIDQSMSLNIHFKSQDDLSVPMFKYLCAAHRMGLKTGAYYTRTLQEVKALNFKKRSDVETDNKPIVPSLKMKRTEKKKKKFICTEEVCTSCSG
jgi:ribonucleoside-diphosphate reductase alpha chain